MGALPGHPFLFSPCHESVRCCGDHMLHFSRRDVVRRCADGTLPHHVPRVLLSSSPLRIKQTYSASWQRGFM